VLGLLSFVAVSLDDLSSLPYLIYFEQINAIRNIVHPPLGLSLHKEPGLLSANGRKQVHGTLFEHTSTFTS
jgi:hypothetical protein